jgi:hypothetical protein
MSDFLDMLVDMLAEHSALQKSDNDVRKVLDRTVGEYMDRVVQPFDELFLETATGSWLDCHGRDYGVPRRLGEDDDSYRDRIVFEKLEYLTVGNLDNIYGVTLYALVDDFDATENTLTSDNPYVNGRGFMAEADSDLQKILNSKFVLDNEVVWI